ncbi:MAG TPA: FMN-binding protein [Pseudonocardia sp.]
MRRISLWFLSTIAVVALLFGYRTSTSGPTPAPAAVAAPAASATAPSTSTNASGATTVTGSVAQTRWGPVQVRITVANGKITAVDVPQSPDGNGRDQQINDYALPILVQSTLSAQNANIDMVSGATVTSTGYLQSLQSALDQAGLA